MKYLIFTIHLLIVLNGIDAIAKQEKIIKKPLGLKPIKEQKSIIDEFRQHLTPEDAEFIKQIDKQFKAHGDKLTIKVEKENSTKANNKNQKRTIDDSLATYSYQQSMHPNGYYFSRPIYMHKFTSRDVPSNQGYVEKATEIEVQQSHSYEIKPDAHYQQSGSKNYQQQQKQQVYEDPVPVIVLKVPGPSKYALHLQALLQQYLEIRAAQFLKVLEEQDRHGQLMNPQQYVPTQEQVAYVPMVAMSYPTQQTYYHSQPQAQQIDFRQQQQYFNYRQQEQLRQQSLYHQQQNFNHHRIPSGQQSYYRQNIPQMHHNQNRPQAQYQKYIPQIYQSPQPAPVVHQSTIITYVTPSYSEEDREPLQTSENYPSDKHTHVIFKKKKHQRVQSHPQPSITYHTDEPIVVPEQASVIVPYNQPEPEEVYVSHPEYPVTHQPTYTNHHQEHQEIRVPGPLKEQVTKTPYNYHVASTLSPSYEEIHERHNPKRMAPFSKEQFEKAKRMMEKSRRNRGSIKADLSQIKGEKSEAKSS